MLPERWSVATLPNPVLLSCFVGVRKRKVRLFVQLTACAANPILFLMRAHWFVHAVLNVGK